MHILKKFTIAGLAVFIALSYNGQTSAQEINDDFITERDIPKIDIVALSVLYPGLGQMTRGEKGKGFSFFLGETLSLLTFINTNESYSTKVKSYNRDLADYNRLSQQQLRRYDQAEELYLDLSKRSKQLDELHLTRNIAIGLAAGIYVYNLIDVVFFGNNISRSHRAENNQNRIILRSGLIGDNYGILLSKSF